MRGIAERAGVSVATVSRVLNGKPDVSSETRERVLSLVPELTDDKIERVNRDATTLRIGFVNDYRAYQIGSHYVGELLSGVQLRAASEGYSVTLLDRDVIERETRWPDKHTALRNYAGLVWSMPVFDERHSGLIEERGLPAVVINNLKQGSHAPFVESDNLSATRQAVEYLVGLGHTRIGFIGGSKSVANFSDRLRGYYQHMKEFGLDPEPDWVIDEIPLADIAGAIEATHRLVGRRNMPTALITASETITVGVYEVFAMRGVRIPDDVSVVGFDDTLLSAHMTPKLTTVRQHVSEMGSAAVDLLIRLIHHPEHIDEHPHILKPMTLIVRDSVREISTEP